MLKIKDDIDLKELEKFGFQKGTDDYVYIDEDEGSHLFVQYENRYIGIEAQQSFWGNLAEDKVLNKLYDLIKADLVVKIND